MDEAITRAEKFLDEATVTDQRELRIVHGHGTGQLRRAIAEFLKNIRSSRTSSWRRRTRAAAAPRSWS